MSGTIESKELSPSRRIRVPARWRGKIRYKPPELLPDGSTVLPNNLTTAVFVITDAKTPDERAVAGIIYGLVLNAEIDRALQAIVRKIG